MASGTKYITSRIDWCRRESTQVCAPLESAGWRAEAEGLQDALLRRDHTTQYQQGPPHCVRAICAGARGRARGASHGRDAPTYCTPRPAGGDKEKCA